MKRITGKAKFNNPGIRTASIRDAECRGCRFARLVYRSDELDNMYEIGLACYVNTESNCPKNRKR